MLPRRLGSDFLPRWPPVFTCRWHFTPHLRLASCCNRQQVQLAVQLGCSSNASPSPYTCCLCAPQVWLRLAHVQGLRRVPGRLSVHTVYAGHRNRRLPASAPHRRQRRELPSVELPVCPPDPGIRPCRSAEGFPPERPAWTTGLWSTK